MQTVETLNEGLKRAYLLTIPASEIAARVDAEVKRAAPQVKMPGFRPGKVPPNLVRKMHGPALMQDALNSSIQQGVEALLAEHKLRPAMRPQVELGDYAEGRDAEVTVALEVLPDVPTPAIEGITLERLTVPAGEEQIEEQIARFAEGQKSWDDAPDGHAAGTGDLVVMDFAGKVDGVAFDGGTGEDMSVEIGSGRLIPGFEDQLIGLTPGDDRQIAVTFPDDYQAKELAGKAATFDLSVKAVKTAAAAVIDDAMAKSLGLESLEQLRGLVKGQIEQELNGLTRTHMKRKLLDQLAAGHDFPVPPSMVDAEFEQIWDQLKHEATHEADPDAALAEMEAERDDYRRIAERRVRLGLLLSEIGQANGVEVSSQEMNRLIAQAAQQYKGEDQKRFVDYIRAEPMAAAQLRAPLYEDKVVDHLFGLAEITDREVTRAELEAAIESEDGFATGTHRHSHDDDHAHDDHHADDQDHADDADDADDAPAPARPARARKVKAAEPASDDATEPAEPVKKAATRSAPSDTDRPVEVGNADDLVVAEPLKGAPTRKPRAKKAAEEA